MKLLILSDNHGDEVLMEEIYSLYDKEVELWLHCGDSEFEALHPMWNIFQTVRGNMDLAEDYKLEKVREFKTEKFLQVHGHKHQVKENLKPLANKAKEQEINFVFYGHTHIPKVDIIDGVCLINPGSLTMPRGQYTVGSYVIFNLNDSKSADVTFYDINHNKMEDLSQKINL